MADNAAQEQTPPPEVPALVKAARTLLKELNAVTIPEGNIRNRIIDDLPVNSKTHEHAVNGLRPVLSALAEFIAEQPTDNRALVARLDGSDGTNIVDLLTEIAITTDKDTLPRKKIEFSDAMMIDGKPVLDLIRVAIANAAGRVAQSEDGGGLAEPPGDKPKPPGDQPPKDLPGPKGWRRELRDKDRPPPDDEAIRRSAQDGPSNVDDDYIKKAARGWDKKHKLPDSDIIHGAGEFDRMHPPPDDAAIAREADGFLGPDGEGFDTTRPKMREIKAYGALAEQLAEKFTAALGNHMALTRQGGRPAGS